MCCDPGKAKEWLDKGKKALGNGDLQGAVTALTESIKIDARKTRPFSLRAKAFVKLKKPKAAIKASRLCL